MTMDPNATEAAYDFHPFFRIYKDGHAERFLCSPFVLPSTDPRTGVRSKDIIISSEPTVSARLYLPNTATHHHHHKLPLLIYFHGGAFSIESALCAFYHYYLNSLVAASGVIALSVEYRLAPEHPIPACYHDSWSALKWASLHAKDNRPGPDPWMNQHADLGRVFLAGDSAGANISHNMAVRAANEGLGSGVTIIGMVLVHPFFGDGKPDKLWLFLCPDTSGADDPRLNPAADPTSLAKIGCEKVLVCTAGKDFLRRRGWIYYEALKKSGWGGVAEIVETEDEEHVFHLINRRSEKAVILMKLMVSFINGNKISSSL